MDVSGQTLTDYNGLLEITNVPNANATKTGTGTITPRIATNAQVAANLATWESTLLRIASVTITGTGTTYSGTQTMTDASGTLALYTRSTASFASTSYPTSSVTVTGVLGNFNGAQLSIRAVWRMFSNQKRRCFTVSPLLMSCFSESIPIFKCD